MSFFTSEQQEHFHIIRCPEEFTDAACDQLALLVKATWLKNPADTHVLDFSAVKEFPRTAYRPFVQFKQALKNIHKSLVSIHINDKILNQMISDGMDLVFNPAESLPKAVQILSEQKPKPKLDIEFINPFISAVKMTFEVQVKLPIEAGKPQLKKKTISPETSIAAVLSLDADTFQGSIILSFPESVFLAVYKNMFGETHTQISQEIQDAAGELLNIIFGAAKRELNDKKGFTIKKALPTVLTGVGLETQKTSQSKVAIVIPCKTQVGQFELEIHLGPGS